ncbi:MAG: hypothetical protein WCB68_21605 [Pyrinomonadaceae bacterium]
MRTKREAKQFSAKVADYAGVLRGKIPAPFVRAMGARDGDHLLFTTTGDGRATVEVERATKKSAKKDTRASKRK